MDDLDRRLIQDKQDQLLTVAKKVMEQQVRITKLEAALSESVKGIRLLNSMVESGEQHSEQSRNAVRTALDE